MQNARLVPMRDVDEQAASHCRQHGLSYRRVDTVWVGPTLERVAYECDWAEQPVTRKPEAGRTPIRAAHPRTAKPIVEDPKTAAWIKAKAATDAWAVCLRFDAERKAKETTKTPQSVAEEVVDACSGLEHAVHKPLKSIGTDSGRFQADLHAQAVQNARDTVTSVRMKTGVSAAKLPAL